MLVSASTVLHPQPPPRRCHWLLNIRRRNGYWEQLGEAPHSCFGPHNREQTAFKFSRRNGILATLGHLFKGNMWETTLFFFQVSLSFYIFLKELFNLTISALKLLCCSYPRTKKTHTHTDLFRENSEFPRSTHKTEISSTSSALPSRGHETEVGAAKRMEGWSGAGPYRETRYQDPKRRRLGRSVRCAPKKPWRHQKNMKKQPEVVSDARLSGFILCLLCLISSL